MKHTIDIPDNYKVVEDHCVLNGDSAKVTLILEKEGKKFEDYVREYYKIESGKVKLVHCLSELYKSTQPISMYNFCGTFEERIGLFKYICEDLKIDWIHTLSIYQSGHNGQALTKVSCIIPKEFLDSILK